MAATRVSDLAAEPALGGRPSALSLGLKRVLGPDYRMGFLFVLPIVVLVLALVAYPFCYAIYLSMTHKFVGMPPVFVGLENYIRLAERRLLPARGLELVHLHVRLGRLQAGARHGDGARADVEDPLPQRSSPACC